MEMNGETCLTKPEHLLQCGGPASDHLPAGVAAPPLPLLVSAPGSLGHSSVVAGVADNVTL